MASLAHCGGREQGRGGVALRPGVVILQAPDVGAKVVCAQPGSSAAADGLGPKDAVAVVRDERIKHARGRHERVFYGKT